jgi:hypothetical protein
MGKTYDQLTTLQREKIWELKEKGISGVKIAELLAAGFPREDPPIPRAKVTPQAINSVYRRLKLERDRLYYSRLASIPTDDVMALNRRKLSQILAAELERLRVAQERGKLDGDQLRKVAGAAERIEKLEQAAARRGAVPDPPESKGARQPLDGGDQDQEKKAPSFADTLAAEAEQRDRELAEESRPAQVDPTQVEAVPDALQAQDINQT